MIRIAFPALALILALALAASPASAQQVTSGGAIHGQAWNMGQNLSSLDAMTRLNSPLARDRAARASRQAQFNQHYSGAPIRQAGR
ncbi:hypothetical protein [Roseococcus sp.]|uniref:hypothetical protein n=1 Tax=Roseococcus sp. TaxID=2109646 RepID=UPI003BAD98D9